MRNYLLNLIWVFFFCVGDAMANPSHFTENKGQIDPSVLFYHKSENQNILLYRDGFAYDNFVKEGEKWVHHRAEIRFQKVNKIKTIDRTQPLNFYENYYQENKEVLKVQSFETIIFKEVYKRIDLRFMFSPSGQFKYDVIVHPGGDLNDVQFKVEGAKASIEENQLAFNLSFGNLYENIPLSYIEETNEKVQVNYVKKGASSFGFNGFTKDLNYTLIVDPEPNLKWGSYFGGSSADEPYSSVIDSFGFIYKTGKTQSNTNISTSGAFQTTIGGNYDGYLSKWDTSGKLIWATYYGGSSYDDIKGIRINLQNELVVVGNTTGSTGLATSGAYRTSPIGNYDGLIMKFNTSGTRIWATYFGGSSIDEFYNVEVDDQSNIYVGGKSSSSGLATSGAYQTSNAGGEDAIMLSFNNSGSLRWCTYLGGGSQDYIWGITFHSDKFIYFSGHTFSSTGIALNAKHQSTFGGTADAFFGKVDNSGNFRWVNYFGGTATDNSIELISVENKLYLTGFTYSNSAIATSGAYKTTNSGNGDAFFLCFDTSGQRSFATYIGGTGFDEIYCVSHYRNKFYIAGKTASSSGISMGDAYQKSLGGGLDNFIMQLDMNGYPLWGTYYGGSGDDRVTSMHVYSGSLYLMGATASASNMATSGSHKSTYGGSGDSYIARFDNLGCGTNFFGKMVRPALCAGDSNGIAAVILTGNAANPTFKWKTNPPQYNDTAFGLPAGFHEVVVSDTFGCIDSLKVMVTEPARLRAIIRDSLNISCNGLTNGRLIADAVGGNSPYFFQWQTTPKISKDTLSGLGVGTYKVRVTDIHNCVDSAVGRITEPDTLKSSISGYNHATCFLLNNGQISASATGGTQPYSYLWSSSPPQTTSTAYNLRAGYYEVQITDKNGCQSKSSYTITEPSPITIGLTGLNHSICYNDSLGEIFTKIWGGTPGYKIQWNSNPLLNTSNLTKLKGGTYRITVTDANNCVESKNIVITEPEPLRITFDTVVNPLCYGSADGSISVSVGGGRPSYQLSWNAPPYSNVNKIVGLKAGMYTLMLKDSVGCTLFDTLKLYNKDSLVITGTIVEPRCFGDANGKLTASVAGGTTPYKFSWAHNPGLNSSLLNNIPSGNYYLSVTDKNACVGQAQFIVNQPNPLDIEKKLQKDVTCYNGADGQLSVTVSGGTVPLRVKWNTLPASENIILNNLKAGNYKITLTDTNGCADSMNFQVNEPAPLLGFFDSIFSPSCYAQQNGTVTYKANGGVKPYRYAFDNGPFQFDSLSTFVKAGWIRVKIIDGNGCTIEDSSLIKQPNQLNIKADINQISCFALQDGKIVLQGSGGIQPYKFQWSHQAKDTHIAHNLNPGTYTVRLTDKNNCTFRDTFQIFQPEKLIGKIDLTLPASCYNVADGLSSASAVGGTPGYEFFWKGPANHTGSSPTGMLAGNYWMYVKDSKGCLDSVSLSVGQPNRISASVITKRSPSCVDSSDGWAEVAPLHGVGPYTYLWSNGNTTARANNLSKGSYWVIITDKCGDTAMAYITISDPAPFIIPNIGGMRASFRGNQETYEIADVAGWNYFWEVSTGTIISGQGTSRITVLWDGPGRGNIRVSVFNSSKCFDDNFYDVALTTECMYVFPNPSNLSTLVLLPSVSPGESIQIFDARGRKVLDEPASVQNNIDVSYFARGIYFIRYRDCVIKFLKE